jgi:hypothetical protein
MKLKLFKEAELELKQFDSFDRPEFYYENHSKFYPNRKNGSMISFGLRMLNAELPYYLGRSDESIVYLQKMLKIIDQTLKMDEIDSNQGNFNSRLNNQ